MKILTLVLRIIAAFILLQTLYFKFSGAEESVVLFTKLGVEPWGRIATGVLELITAALLLIPSTVLYGALMGAGIMAGAIASHLFIIGIESAGDGGLLFGMAVFTFIACISLLFIYRQHICKLIPNSLK